MHDFDLKICVLLKQHKIEGVELLFNEYYRPLVLWADTFLNDVGQAEDLVQEFFVKLWEKKIGDDLLPETLKSYLFTAIKNQTLNLLEKFDPLKQTYDVNQLNYLCGDYEDLTEKMLSKVEAEIEKLPSRSRDVVKGVYLEGLSYKEVAQKYDISVATVKTLLVNSLKRLREECDHLEEILLLFFLKKVSN